MLAIEMKFKKFRRAMNNISPEITKEVDAVFTKYGKKMVIAGRELAPKKTGQYADSIQLVVEKTASGINNFHIVAGLPIWRWMEFGTINHAPRPHLLIAESIYNKRMTKAVARATRKGVKDALAKK